jgi:hypothetical protein
MKQILSPIDTNISNKTINNKNKINSNTNNDNIDSPTQYSPASVVTNIDLLTHKETLVKKNKHTIIWKKSKLSLC